MAKMMLYNGVELPNIESVWTPELKETYPFAVIRREDDGTYQIRLSTAAPYMISSSVNLIVNKPFSRVIYKLVDGVWIYDSDVTVSGSGTSVLTAASPVFWTSVDIPAADGSIYLAATDPVAPNAPTFTPADFLRWFSMGQAVRRGLRKPKTYTVKLSEIAATTSDRYYPDNLYYTNYCQINGSNYWDYNSYLMHDLSEIPSGATILSAKLYVYCNFHGDNAANSLHNIVRILEPWDETAVTWNNAPPVSEETYLDKFYGPPDLNTWGNWDITSLVQEWIDGTYPNYGLRFYTNQSGEWRYHWQFYNRRHNEGEYATYIEVEYSL